MFFRVSRKALWDSNSDTEEAENSDAFVQTYKPDLIFEDVNESETTNQGNAESDNEKQEKEEEEFDFNLFSTSTKSSTDSKKPAVIVLSKKEEIKESDLIPKDKVLEDITVYKEIPLINQQRPESYYFSWLSPPSKDEINSSAVSYEQVISIGNLYSKNTSPDRVINYTKLAEEEKARRMRERKHRRPGKKSRQRVKAMLEKQKEIRKQMKNRKGGFQKNFKSSSNKR